MSSAYNAYSLAANSYISKSGPSQPFGVELPTSPHCVMVFPNVALLSVADFTKVIFSASASNDGGVIKSGNLFTRAEVVLRPPHPPLIPAEAGSIEPPNEA